MDRPLLYPAAVPAETDTLSVAKNCLVGLGFLFQDLIGMQTLAASLPCSPGVGLTVTLGAGRIYSLQQIDATPYSSLGTDNHNCVKQGILPDALTLACPAPGTSGQSVAYLIEATYADVDTNLVTLPYYDAANPLIAYSGPGNDGAAQATVRSGELQVRVKAGTPAASGSQVTPTADTTWIGLYVVTVAHDALTLLSDDIVQITANFLPQGPYMPLSASFVTPAELASAVAPLASSVALANDLSILDGLIASAQSNAQAFATAAIAAAIAALPIVKAGNFTAVAGTVTVAFATPFPTGCTAVSVDWEYVGPDVGWVVPGSRNANGFSYQSGNGGACTYTAVGN
jgi:hypothetical protein